MLTNREVFATDPATATIPNDGVAKVVEPSTPEEWDVLRYELRTFVCDGEYAAGLERILSTYLRHLGQPVQPAAWVSGFYGSGKSHLVRVLTYLWRNVEFPEGVRARALATLPPEIEAALVELSTAGRQAGGLWAAAGTLGAGAGNSVRLALLGILLRAAGLPERYASARLVLWLHQNGYRDAVRAAVEAQGRGLERELQNMYVSPVLAQALIDVIPGFAASTADARNLLRTQYPNPDDISDGDLLQTMADVLALQSTTPDRLPCALLVFDELQQFLAEDVDRTRQVQNVVESCSGRFGSRLLFVATGQNALQATTNLQRLRDRFTVQVSLSDADVEKVVRQVVLRKAQDRTAALQGVLDRVSGEIDRHLAGTRIGPTPADAPALVPDYPLLPVRRRFWEHALRAVDQLGSAGQLRTQLRLVHDAVRTVAERPLGWVIAGDALYDQQKAGLLMSGALSAELESIIADRAGRSADGRLEARLCALVYFIERLPTDGPLVAGIRADASTLADLLVEDLPGGSGALRQRVPELLAALVEAGTLMQVGDEYRLQTRASAEWEADYRARRGRLLSDQARLASDRATALRAAVDAALRRVVLAHGTSKTRRELSLHYGPEAPTVDGLKVPVWVRDEWSASEHSVRDEAQAAGPNSPIVFVLLPRREADALQAALASAAAARETIEARPAPSTDEGKQARTVMDSRRQREEGNVAALVQGILENARVFQGGGSEVGGEGLAEMVRAAAEAALARLFPRYADADDLGWSKVVARARQGAGDALLEVGHGGSAEEHPVCQQVRAFVGAAGRKGSDVRRQFAASPYGWPQDAVDGALLALVAAEVVTARHNGQDRRVRDLNQTNLGPSELRSSEVVVTHQQRIGVRGLAQNMGLPCKQGEEGEIVPRLLQRLAEQAERAGGAPPRPERPSTATVEALQAMVGNEQLVAVYAARDALLADYKAWQTAAAEGERRLPRWQALERLLEHARDLPEGAAAAPQVEAIRANRALLAEPDPVPPLRDALAGALRTALQAARQRLADAHAREVGALAAADEWQRLPDAERERLTREHRLESVPALDLRDDEALLRALAASPLASWADQVAALPARAAQAREAAARLIQPATVRVTPPSATLRTTAEVDTYLAELRGAIMAEVAQGKPVMI
jgi:hypothetical protein